ncbi:MAG: hypothetical protein AAFO79_03025 [Pseudomonadota bacterium]
MEKLIYRGVEHTGDEARGEKRIFRRPELNYRGIAHNGVRTLEQRDETLRPSTLTYRGVRLA